MKYILLLVFVLTPIANAESWIELDVPRGTINYIDRDSIEKKGDFAYYTMKFDYSDKSDILRFKHDCKYKARTIIKHSRLDKNNNEIVLFDDSSETMSEYNRTMPLIKLEKMVCEL